MSNKKNKRKVAPFGRFLNILGMLIIIAALVACLAIALPRFAKIQSYVVVSGSMEPAIPVWSLVYARPVEPETLEAGDIIVFYSTDPFSSGGGNGQNSATPVTHRVIENNKERGELITKGDANENNDFDPVAYINVEGKVTAHLPWAGRLAVLLATGIGKLSVALVILAGYLLTEAGSRISS